MPKNHRDHIALLHSKLEIAPLGSDLYYALRFTPKDQHPTIVGILRFYHDIFNIVFNATDAGVMQTKLNWWGDEITKMHQRKSAHPTLQLLSSIHYHKQHIESPRLDRGVHSETKTDPAFKPLECGNDCPPRTPTFFTTHLLKLLNAVSDGLYNFTFPTFDDVCAHLKRTVGLRELLIQEALGNEEHDATMNLAVSLGLLEIIQHFYFYVRKELIPIAQADISALQLETIFNNPDETPENLKILLKKYHEYAKDLFEKTATAIPKDSTLKNLILRNKVALSGVEAIAEDGYRVLEHQVTITALKKLAVAWRG